MLYLRYFKRHISVLCYLPNIKWPGTDNSASHITSVSLVSIT